MKKKVIKLTESDLRRIVNRVISEQKEVWRTEDPKKMKDHWYWTKETFIELELALKNPKIVGDELSKVKWNFAFDHKYLWLAEGTIQPDDTSLGEVFIQFTANDPYELHISMRMIKPEYRHKSETFIITDFADEDWGAISDIEYKFGNLVKSMYNGPQIGIINQTASIKQKKYK